MGDYPEHEKLKALKGDNQIVSDFIKWCHGQGLKWPPPVGEVVRVGNKLYATCSDCGKVVCLNKMFFGSVHLCK